MGDARTTGTSPTSTVRKNPSPGPLFPELGWEMRWHGDQPYLDRPCSTKNGVKKNTRRRPLTKISVTRQEGMKPGDKGRVTLPDGRCVEYVVPDGLRLV